MSGIIRGGYTFLVPSKLANFTAEKTLSPEKCPVHLTLHWIGNVSSKFENQINKAIKSCFYAVIPRVAYITRVILPSAKKIALLPLRKVVLFMTFHADVKLCT